MRGQSLRAASRCENAKTPRCTCRCGGKLHGAKRAGKDSEFFDPEADREFFEGLPVDDAHHVASAAEKKQARKLARAERVRAEQVERGQTGLFDEA